jgi:hypothetical protein
MISGITISLHTTLTIGKVFQPICCVAVGIEPRALVPARDRRVDAYWMTPQAMRAPPPPSGAGWSE